jgi:hypothetical protein
MRRWPRCLISSCPPRSSKVSVTFQNEAFRGSHRGLGGSLAPASMRHGVIPGARLTGVNAPGKIGGLKFVSRSKRLLVFVILFRSFCLFRFVPLPCFSYFQFILYIYALDYLKGPDASYLTVGNMIRCEGYIPLPLGAELRACTLSQIPYENNQPRCLRRGWLIDIIIIKITCIIF